MLPDTLLNDKATGFANAAFTQLRLCCASPGPDSGATFFLSGR
jgi:hypothetical protein